VVEATLVVEEEVKLVEQVDVAWRVVVVQESVEG
jgi:hypothetical protein